MRGLTALWRPVGALVLWLLIPALARAQTAPGQPAAGGPAPPPATAISLDDAVRLALEHNPALRAQRLNIDLSKADEVTAGLKPNPVFTSTNENFDVFTPSRLGDNITNEVSWIQSFSYLFERGGKRKKRMLVARDTTSVTSLSTKDAERQLKFDTAQAFVDVLLARSNLDFAQQDLKNFTDIENINRQRVAAGDLAEAEFYKIELQRLQFEQDLTSAQAALVQAKAALRQNVGFDALAENFDTVGDLTYTPQAVTLDAIQQAALQSRPDLQAALGSVKLAQDGVTLEYGNRSRDLTGEVEYDRVGTLNSIGFGLSIELPFHDRNQGNIAHSEVALKQAGHLVESARTAVLTDVANAWSSYQSSLKTVMLFQGGYLQKAKDSLDISTYVYEHGNGTLLDLLDAERTYRATELAYRQALAAYRTSVEQINFVVGKQVMQ
jgi:cobalt-zinc-cadmium efflux system outer membrane protein